MQLRAKLVKKDTNPALFMALSRAMIKNAIDSAAVELCFTVLLVGRI